MKSYIKNIYIDSIHSILKTNTNYSEKYFHLYDASVLLHSQIIEELDHPSIDSKFNEFSQFSILCQTKNIPDHLRFAWFKILGLNTSIHLLNKEQMEERFLNAFWTSTEIFKHLDDDELPQEIGLNNVFPSDHFWSSPSYSSKVPDAKIIITKRKRGSDLSFHGYWVEQYGKEVIIRPGKLMNSDLQIKALQTIEQEIYLPVFLQLIDIEISGNELYPGAIVLSPDYLIDITSIAKCFTPFGVQLSMYLLGKIQKYELSSHLLIGNSVNMILDELIFNPSLSLQDITSKIFNVNELSWTCYNNQEAREHLKTIETHFNNLKRTVNEEFPQYGISHEDCIVEPSFFSPLYGIQGRLDLLYENRNAPDQKIIIELKSGKTFRPNSYGLNHSHYIQTLLYDLLIQSSYPHGGAPVNYILYSAEPSKNLRHAPAIKEWKYEALGVRNLILCLEWQMANWTKNHKNLYQILSDLKEHLVGFAERDRNDFYKDYENSSSLKKEYFDAFIQFITREQFLSKLGKISSERSGQSSLWNTSWMAKNINYNLLDGLEVIHDYSGDENPLVHFIKTDHTNPLANFRKGDIILTYPEIRKDHPLHGRVYRCTLVENSAEKVVIRLRAKQYQSIFTNGTRWVVENDQLDSSFRAMFQSLALFLKLPESRTKLLMGERPSKKKGSKVHFSPLSGLTSIQNDILAEMLLDQEYYLLWGPPGTGKTSVMLHQFVKHKMLNGQERLLIMGYTNRAVDEICESLLKIDSLDRHNILRIGSRYGTSEDFQDLLLQVKNSNIKNRSSLQDLLDKSRIICGTLASISGKEELFQLVKFDRILIDEASQILEPGIIGLLSKGIPFVLIGDHKQLPAVVAQSEEESITQSKALKKIGLQNLSNSFFERIFKINQESNWDYSFGILKHQGRMHTDLMIFPNKHFYENILEVLPFAQSKQNGSLNKYFSTGSKVISKLFNYRNIFIPTKEKNDNNPKINSEESKKVVNILKELEKSENTIDWHEVGIITPYRAQIAQIVHEINSSGFSDKGITVDTVERYQGGAKDIVIISYCLNSLAQLHMLNNSITLEGIDRKLNVALTRARQQIIILANKELLMKNPLYRDLIKGYFEWNPK